MTKIKLQLFSSTKSPSKFKLFLESFIESSGYIENIPIFQRRVAAQRIGIEIENSSPHHFLRIFFIPSTAQDFMSVSVDLNKII